MRMVFGLGALSVALLSWEALGFDPEAFRGMIRAIQAQPAEVRSHTMEVRKRENVIRYKGNVIVSQPNYRLEAQEVELRWDPQGGKVRQLLAKGDVRMEAEDVTGRCGIAVMDLEKGIVEMRESPRMVQGGERVEGEVIIYSLDERKSTVLGGKTGRVRTVVIPGGTK